MNQIAFVCIMGIGTVFIGLVCIVALCSLVSLFCNKLLSGKDQKIVMKAAKTETQKIGAPAAIPASQRKKILAAVCAVIAEENGCEVNAIRVKSFKKI